MPKIETIVLSDFDEALARWRIERRNDEAKAQEAFIERFSFENLLELAFRGRNVLGTNVVTKISATPTIFKPGAGS